VFAQTQERMKILIGELYFTKLKQSNTNKVVKSTNYEICE